MDRYYEQLTSAYRSKLYDMYGFLMIVMAVIFVLFIFNSLFPVAIIAGGLGVLFFFLRQKEYVEYEYVFTNGDVDIDIIMAAKKRKRLVSFDIKSVIAMAPVGSYSLDGAPKGKKLIAYPKNNKEKVFITIVNKDNAVIEVHFTPNEEFVNLCFRTNPQNIKKT